MLKSIGARLALATTISVLATGAIAAPAAKRPIVPVNTRPVFIGIVTPSSIPSPAG